MLSSAMPKPAVALKPAGLQESTKEWVANAFGSFVEAAKATQETGSKTPSKSPNAPKNAATTNTKSQEQTLRGNNRHKSQKKLQSSARMNLETPNEKGS